LLQLMRSDCESPEKSAAYPSLRQLKQNVVPHLLLHMDEPALCAPSNGANPSFRGEAFYYVPGRDWYGPPTTVGDVVVTIIEDIAGQEFTSPGRSKSTDIGAHLAIYALGLPRFFGQVGWGRNYLSSSGKKGGTLLGFCN